MQILNIKENDKILIIAPHPDDECIGVGGIISLYPDKCEVYVLTDGSLAQGEISREQTKVMRRQEFEKAMQSAGVQQYRMLELEDGALMQHTDCLEKISLAQYTKIFVTGPQDKHPDHTAAYLSIMSALKKQKLHEKEIFLYEVHASLKAPTHMLDITKEMNKKQKLIRCHASQISNMPYDRLVRTAAEYHALQERMIDRYIEIYSKVIIGQDTDYHLQELELKLQKQIQFYQLLTKWLHKKINGADIEKIFRKKEYFKIAIYGYAELGQLVFEELQKSRIEVSYILDKKIRQTDTGVPVLVPEKQLPVVDAVVVTAIFYYEEIREELLQKGFKNVISLKTIVDMMQD